VPRVRTGTPQGTLRVLQAAAPALNVITMASSPVLAGEWLEPGQHINAAGFNSLIRREIDGAAVKRCARVVVDSRARATSASTCPSATENRPQGSAKRLKLQAWKVFGSGGFMLPARFAVWMFSVGLMVIPCFCGYGSAACQVG